MRCLAFLLFAFISFDVASEPSNFYSEDLKPEASEYARAAGLAPLTSTTDFELRVWTLWRCVPRRWMKESLAGR